MIGSRQTMYKLYELNSPTARESLKFASDETWTKMFIHAAYPSYSRGKNNIPLVMTVGIADTDIYLGIEEVKQVLTELNQEIDEVCLCKDGIHVIYDNRSDWAVINFDGSLKTMSKMGQHEFDFSCL